MKSPLLRLHSLVNQQNQPSSSQAHRLGFTNTDVSTVLPLFNSKVKHFFNQTADNQNNNLCTLRLKFSV